MVNQSMSRLGEDSAEFSGSTDPSEGYNLHSTPLLPPGKLFKRDQTVTLDIFTLIVKSYDTIQNRRNLNIMWNKQNMSLGQ